MINNRNNLRKSSNKLIKFNSWTSHLLKSGDKMYQDTLENISVHVKEDTPKDKLPWLQVFNSGYRVSSVNVDWNTWNGCVFIDIDSKKYYNDVKKFDTDKVLNDLYNYLVTYYSYNFYCIQKSNSKTSYHIFFYFDVDKNESNFKKCANYAMNIVSEAFDNIGYSDVFNYDGVADCCCISQYQGIYVTNQKIYYNEFLDSEFYGKWVDINEYELPINTYENDVNEIKENLVSFNTKTELDNGISIHLGHHERMMTYTALVGVFGSKEKCDKEWSYICDHLREGKHDKKFYLNEPNKNKWFERYKSEYAKVYRLEKFGYQFTHKYVPKYIDMYKADVVYELNEDQKLSDINLDLKEDKINEIYAGCGLGKTYMSKMLGEEYKTNTIEQTINWIFNEGWNSKRVCFISPMRSINKDSFENIENWCIIDGEHKENNLNEIINSAHKKNICTTWESFVLREMYNIDFDYVIVDEIHTLYMYDYRLNSISDLKRYLPISKGIKIIMTGTPSLEADEFDCWKIQVKKKQREIPCDLIVYNDTYTGYVYSDIKGWVTADKNNLALIFKDTVNYTIEEELKNCYGIDCDIYNKSYSDTTEYITKNKTVKKQVTAFSVYGQAGINLYIDDDKKVRLYILSDNAMSIIQYANRVRNKEVIDKIIIPYKKSNITNTVLNIDTNIDIEDAKKRLAMLIDERIKTNDDPIQPIEKYDRLLKVRCGFNVNCIECIDIQRNEYILKEENYRNYKLIKNTINYEKQLSIIYTRMKDNYIVMNQIELEKDVKRCKETKQRNNQFCGQMKRLLKENMFEVSKITELKNAYYFKPDEQMKKVLTGDVKERIESIYNYLVKYYFNDPLLALEEFRKFIRNRLYMNETIKKSDFTNYDEILKMKAKWDDAMDAGLITLLMKDTDIEKLSAAFTRMLYKEGMTDKQWQKIVDESYDRLKYMKRIVYEYIDVLEDELYREVLPLDYICDRATEKIYTYIHNKHNRGKIGGKIGGKKKGKNQKKVIVKGKEFESVNAAAEYYGVTRMTINRWLK